ncbi:MAG: recombinase family protein [Actinomycetota bacterium]
MNALIYLRVSTKEQASKDETGEGYSIPAQREACLRYISEHSWSVGDEFVDAGESARSADRIDGRESAKVVLDPKRAFLVKEAFRLYSTGEY